MPCHHALFVKSNVKEYNKFYFIFIIKIGSSNFAFVKRVNVRNIFFVKVTNGWNNIVLGTDLLLYNHLINYY